VRWQLEELPKLFETKPRITDNPTHRKCVDWIVARNGEDPCTVCHDNMCALPQNSEASFLQCSHSAKVIDSRQLWQDIPLQS
jgi:hypothetical protein